MLFPSPAKINSYAKNYETREKSDDPTTRAMRFSMVPIQYFKGKVAMLHPYPPAVSLRQIVPLADIA